METPSEQSAVAMAINKLWALAKHWEYKAKDATTAEIRETHLHAARQLRGRIDWLEQKVAEQESQKRRAESIAVLETFRLAGWIEGFTVVDDDIKYWPTEKGRGGARAFLELLKFAPKQPRDVKLETLEMICGWLAGQSGDTPAAAQA